MRRCVLVFVRMPSAGLFLVGAAWPAYAMRQAFGGDPHPNNLKSCYCLAAGSVVGQLKGVEHASGRSADVAPGGTSESTGPAAAVAVAAAILAAVLAAGVGLLAWRRNQRPAGSPPPAVARALDNELPLGTLPHHQRITSV